ncbi:MAG: hypothetical protein VXA39_03685 [Deltaproteobacteria bacterium]
MPRWTARLFGSINTVLAQKSNRTDAARVRLLDRWEEHQKESWEFNRDKYRWRHLIENFFAKLKQYRGIATLYDQRDCAFLGDTHRVAAVI